MITSTALQTNDALQGMVTTLESSGGSLPWETVGLGVLGLIVVGFIAWFLFFRKSGD